MATFGLITEGITDQVIIENILTGYFNNPDLIVNPLLPLRDETDKNRAENFSNWFLVFEYCKTDKFKQAFQFNDYIIVQIDTDTSEEKHYDIPKHEQGKELSPEELIKKVIQKFTSLIGQPFYQKYQNKIIFAVAVHTIECWLLPLYFTDKKKSKIKSCIQTLNRQLGKVEKFTIDSKNKNPKYYEAISNQYCKHKTLINLYKENSSLKIFINDLQKRNITIDEEKSEA